MQLNKLEKKCYFHFSLIMLMHVSLWAFRISSRLLMHMMCCLAHALVPTCLTKWNMLSSAGGGRSRNSASLCLTGMWYSAKSTPLLDCYMGGAVTVLRAGSSPVVQCLFQPPLPEQCSSLKHAFVSLCVCVSFS